MAEYTVRYSAASAGQTLQLSFTMTANHFSGTISLAAATLSEAAVPATSTPTSTRTLYEHEYGYSGKRPRRQHRDSDRYPHRDSDCHSDRHQYRDSDRHADRHQHGDSDPLLQPSTGTATVTPTPLNTSTASSTPTRTATALATRTPPATATATSTPGGGGSLVGTNSVAPGAVNLTSEGTADWADWGLTTANSFDH